MISFVKNIEVNQLNNECVVEISYAGNTGVLVRFIRNNGIIRVSAQPGWDIVSFCDAIVGCLYNESNFFVQVAESLEYDINKICKTSIECEFNGVVFMARKGEVLEDVHKKWISKMNYMSLRFSNDKLKCNKFI